MILLTLTACNRGNQSKEAVRQGVIDHLSNRNLNMGSMDIDVTSVQFNGDEANAMVVFTPKGAGASQGMTLRYRMQRKRDKWEVVSTEDSGHGGQAPAGTPNPHGAGAIPAPQDSPHGAMPSPEDLPPTKK